jgi:hypothetical protein
MRRAIVAVVDFVVGDDIWVAAGVAGAVVLTAVVAHLTVDPWWLLPLAVPAVVAVSLARATRRRQDEPGVHDRR